jgi:hypothetical protein
MKYFAFILLPSSFGSLHLFRQNRHQIEHVNLRSEFREVENWRGGVGVDRDDHFAVANRFDVFGRAADAEREIQFRLDHFAGLADEARRREPTLVNHRTRAGDDAAQCLRQFLRKLDVVLVLNATPNRNEDRFFRDIHVAAEEVFARRGYHEARMDDIAEAAELAKGTLYYYFRIVVVMFMKRPLDEAPLATSLPLIGTRPSSLRSCRA